VNNINSSAVVNGVDVSNYGNVGLDTGEAVFIGKKEYFLSEAISFAKEDGADEVPKMSDIHEVHDSEMLDVIATKMMDDPTLQYYGDEVLAALKNCEIYAFVY
jgi:hypothetical protein